MSHITCLCGEIINVAPYPNHQGFSITFEELEEPILDNLTRLYDESNSADEFYKKASLILSHVQTPGILYGYECKNCHRICVCPSPNTSEKIIIWFKPEEIISKKTIRELMKAAKTD